MCIRDSHDPCRKPKKCLLDYRLQFIFHKQDACRACGSSYKRDDQAPKYCHIYNLFSYNIPPHPVSYTHLPGIVGADDIPEGFSFAVSDNVPTCRLLDGPYSGNYDESQVYVLDGFIVSNNIKVNKVGNIDTDFEYTDHQPVRMEAICLKDGQ